MEPLRQTKTLLILLLVNLVAAVPVQWQSNSCSNYCSQDPNFVRFTVGKTYIYRLQTETAITAANGHPQTLGVSASVELTAHSQCDVSLQLRDSLVTGVDTDTANLFQQQLELEPIQFGYDDGLVTDVCPSAADQLWAIDVKKSIISALQMSARSVSTKSVVLERDISGQCETEYLPISGKYDVITVQKIKRLNKCQNRQQSQFGLFPRLYDQTALSSLPLFNGSFECQQTIDKDLISGATCREWQTLRGSGISIQSQLNIRFDRQISQSSVRRVQQFRQYNNHLLMSSFDHKNSASESDLIQVLRTICHQIQSEDNKEQTVESFPELVTGLTHAQQSVVQRLAKSVKNQEICSSDQLWDLFLDASALAASEGSAEVLANAYTSGDISRQKSNYLFSLLSFTSSPSTAAVQQLIPLLKKAPKHVILGITGLIHNVKHVTPVDSRIHQLAKEAMEALQQRLQNEKKDSEVVATIQAMENIGLEESSSSVVNIVLRLATDSRQSTVVRVAALRALTEVLNDRQRESLLEVFERQQESNEIRIASYKAVVMSGASTAQLQKIRDLIQNERNRDVQQYVRSHQKNLRETSDPHKKYVLPVNAPKFSPPMKQWFGISNHFESSFLLDALSMGVALEADVINGRDSEIPRFIVANVTVPAFGKELQLLEFQIRQKGFDGLLRQKIQNLKNKQNGGNLVSQMIAEAIDMVANVDQWPTSGRDLELQVSARIDGKTIVSFDLLDSSSDWSQLWHKLRQQLQQRVDIDRAFAVQPINARLRIPNTNGFPIQMRINATFMTSLKATTQLSNHVIQTKIAPTIAVQLEAGVEFAANTHKKAVEAVARISSSPVWDSKIETKDERIFSAKFNFPKEKQSLVRFESHVYQRDQSGQRRAMNSNSHWFKSNNAYTHCTHSTRKALGMELCAQLSSEPLFYELFIQKSEKSLKSMDLSIEVPAVGSDHKKWRIAFNSPNSEVDRELSAEVEVNGYKEAKIAVKSPWIRWSLGALLRNEDKEQSMVVDMQKNGKKVFSLDAGVESQTRGQKREYRPHLRIQMSPQSELIAMQGSVSVSKGRKNQLQINLEGNQKQFLKGSFVREGEKQGNDFRISSDLTLNVPQIEIRINGLGDKGLKHLNTDLTVEYRLKGQTKKESLKMSAKVQNLTQSAMTKMSAFSELTSTQFPNFNFHLAYNLLAKPMEHVENEFTMAWAQHLARKVHVLHVSKYTPQSRDEYKVENTLDIEMTPLGVNYELRANADVRGGAKNPKYSVELVGKDRTGRKENDVRGQLEYNHVSRSPLHLTMEVTVKTSGREMSYSDDLRELSSGEYSGHTAVQWQRGQKAELNYNYKTRNNEFHHQMEAEVKYPNSGHPIKHSGLLRLTRDQWQLKSKLNHGGNQLYDLDTLLARNGKSHFAVDCPQVSAKMTADVYQIPQLATFEISSPKNLLHHKTSFELIPKISFAIKSDTKRNNRNLFALDSHVSRTNPSRLVLNSDPIEARFDMDPLSAKKSAKLYLKSYDWNHSSDVTVDPNQRYSLNSKTERNGNPWLSLDSLVEKKNSYLNLNLPQHQTALALNANRQSAALEFNSYDLKHKTSSDWSPNHVTINSKSDFQRKPYHSLDYQYTPGQNYHSLNTEFGNNYRLEAEGQQYGQPFVRVGAKSRSLDFEHNSKLSVNKNVLTVESKTRQSGDTIADVTGLLSRDRNVESTLRLTTPTIRALVSATPSYGAKVEWNCPRVNHVTSLQWPNGDYVIDSKSESKASKKYLNFYGKHVLKESFVSSKNSLFDSEIQWIRDQPKIRVQLVANKPSVIPYNHVTEYERNGNGYQLSSRTVRANDNQHVFGLNGRYNHLDINSPSALTIKYGGDLEGKLRVQPFHRQQKSLNFELKNPNYNHVTDILLEKKSLKVDSRTTDSFGQNVAKVDSYLTPSGQRSHFSLKTQNYGNGNIEFEPKKSFKMAFNTLPVQHSTEIYSQTGNGFKVVSKTTKNSKNLLNLNSAFDFQGQQPSHVTIDAPYVSSHVMVNPVQRLAKIQFQGFDFDHKSGLSFPTTSQWEMSSRTERRNQLLADLKAKISAAEDNHLEVEIPHFSAKTSLDFGKRIASIDYRSKMRNGRHLLASIAINPKDNNGFHSDIAWDLQRDPNQRLIVDITSRRESGQSWSKHGQIITEISATYAGNQLKTESRMTEGQLVNGPHDWSIHYLPKYNPSRDSLYAEFKHVINNNNEMECNALYSEGEKQKFNLKVNAKSDQSGDSQWETVVSVETTAPLNPELQMKWSLSERHSKNYHDNLFLELKGIKNSKNYEISGQLKRENNYRINGHFRAETPEIGKQEMDLLVDMQKKTLSLSASNENSKQFEVFGRVLGQSVSFDLKSNTESIPQVSSSANYIPGQEVSFTIDLDAVRKVDFAVKKSSQSLADGMEVKARLETSYWPQMSTNQKLRWNGKQFLLDSRFKYNNEEVMAAEVNARRDGYVWSGEAKVVSSGAEVLSGNLESLFNEKNLKYVFNANTNQWKGIHVTFNLNQSEENERNLNLKICSQEDKCFDIKSAIKYRKYWSYPIPQRFWLSITKMGTNFDLKTSLWESVPKTSMDSKTSILGVTADEDIVQKIRNQFLVSINSHQYGFESMIQSRDHRHRVFDSSLKMFFPSNSWILLTTDVAKRQLGNGNQEWVQKIQLSSSDSSPLLDISARVEEDQEEYKMAAKISSPKWKNGEKNIQIFWRKFIQSKPFSTKIILNLSKNPNNALTIDTQISRQAIQSENSYFSGQQYNNSLTFDMSTRDKQLIDFSLRGHVSSRSAGLLYSNVKRNGEKVNGFYYLKTSHANNRFEAIVRNNENKFRIDGKFGKSGQQMATDLTVFDEISGQSRDYRLSVDQKCLLLEQKAKDQKRYKLCLNLDNQKDKTLGFSLETTDPNTGHQSVDMNLEVDTRSDKAVKLAVNWSPALIQKWINQWQQSSHYSSSDWLSEWIHELRHKWSVIGQQWSDEIAIPFLSLVSDETADLISELMKNFRPLERVVDIWDHLLTAIGKRWEPLEQLLRSEWRFARKQCKRFELCYKSFYWFENYGFSSLANISDLFYAVADSLFRQTHRLVVTTSGRLIKALPDWPENYYFQQYFQSLKNFFLEVVNSNDDFRQLIQSLKNFFTELMRENPDHVRWSEVKESANQMADIVFSRSALSSSSRVLVWDPKRGRVQLEIRSPAIHSRRLRAIGHNITEKVVKKSSESSSSLWTQMQHHVTIQWTQEVIFWSKNGSKELSPKTLRTRRNHRSLVLATNGPNLEISLSRDRKRMKISVNSDLRWSGHGLDIDLQSERSLSISGSKGEESFRLKWIPILKFISFEFNFTGSGLSVQSRRRPEVHNNTSDHNLNDFLCRKWFDLYIRSLPEEYSLCAVAEDVCDFGATLVTREVISRLPNECLNCAEDHHFGHRKRYPKAESEAEILFLIGCDLESHDLKSNLIRMSNALKREFELRGIHVTFQSLRAEEDGNYRRFWPHFEAWLNLRRLPFPHNSSHSFDFLYVTSQSRRPISRHILMIECQPLCSDQSLDFVSARSHFLHSNAFLHVLTADHFRVRAKKARHVIGIDAEHAYDTARLESARELRQHVSVSRDLCHVMALETNGTVFRLKALKQKNSRQLLAKRIADNHVTQTCIDCDCVLTRDQLTAGSECHLCGERNATLGHVRDDSGVESQEWRPEDDDSDDDEWTTDDDRNDDKKEEIL